MSDQGKIEIKDIRGKIGVSAGMAVTGTMLALYSLSSLFNAANLSTLDLAGSITATALGGSLVAFCAYKIFQYSAHLKSLNQAASHNTGMHEEDASGTINPPGRQSD